MVKRLKVYLFTDKDEKLENKKMMTGLPKESQILVGFVRFCMRIVRRLVWMDGRLTSRTQEDIKENTNLADLEEYPHRSN